MNQGNTDGFESYRRERTRHRLSKGGGRPSGKQGSVLQQLEEAEANEVRNQRLTREVQEFFEDATRTAASIVSQVAEHAEHAHGEHVGVEMSDFLTATIQRAQELVHRVQSTIHPDVSAQDVETNIQNIVGPVLDEFRHEGNSTTSDDHIGQDPFATDPAEVSADLHSPAVPQDRSGVDFEEFATALDWAEQRSVDRPEDGSEDDSGVEDHAQESAVEDPTGAGPEMEDGVLWTEDVESGPPSQGPSEPEPGVAPPVHSIDEHLVAEFESSPEPGDLSAPVDACASWFERIAGDSEQLRTALKLFVRHQVMTRDEARAIYVQVRGG